MFYRGKNYDVKPRTNLFLLALSEFVEKEICQSVPVLQFFVDHLVIDFEHPITEENRAELFRIVDLALTDQARSRILDVKRQRDWEEQNA